MPPVAREEEHEEFDEFELGGAGAAGAGLPCALAVSQPLPSYPDLQVHVHDPALPPTVPPLIQ